MERKEKELFLMALEKHAVEEEAVLGEYRALAVKLQQEEPASLLVDLILAEEKQHHDLLRRMVERLKGPFTEKTPGRRREADQEQLLARSRRLRAHEKQTIEACRSLKSRITTDQPELFDAVLDDLILDSEKHHRLLVAVEKMVAG